jgi:hypothetical protein
MHDQSASRISGRTRAAVSAMCVRALRITVLKSAGNFTRDECHDLSAEKIQRVKCFMFTRCGICCVPAIFERRRGRLGSNCRDLIVKRLNKIPHVVCPNPGGAFYAMAKLPIDDSDKFCQWLLESFSYKDQTVMLAPATGFYGTKGLGKNEVRLAYVLNLESINAAMDCLEKALQQYPGKQEKNFTASIPAAL